MSGQDKQEHEIFVRQREELNVEGNDLKIGILDTDRGIVTITGKINGVYYSGDQTDTRRSLWSRLFK